MTQTGSLEYSLAFNHVLLNRNPDTHRHHTNIDQYIHCIISPQKPRLYSISLLRRSLPGYVRRSDLARRTQLKQAWDYTDMPFIIDFWHNYEN